MAPSPSSADEGTFLVPDLLEAGLRLVFVGTAPSRTSAAQTAYYAHPGNRFWQTLHEVGLTPHRLRPTEFARLLDEGIGLTDICKTRSGNDREISPDDYDVPGLLARLTRAQPRRIAFTSKTAAGLVLGIDPGPLDYGPVRAVSPIKRSELYILPSPSGQARRYWNIEYWKSLQLLLDSGQNED